ncbi:MAG: hypothetical protein ABI624_04640 [Casimicrobiaceae bacterium]
MNPDEIYAKTERGLQELKERKLNLSIALRSVLILVDGERTVLQILAQSQSLKVDDRALTALERSGLIVKRYGGRSGSETTAVPAERTADEVQRFLRVQRLMDEAINKHLGFRGYGLMLRLQKTSNLRDLHDLLPDFAVALVKRIGFDAAKPLVDEMEQLTKSGL